jgi:hypothetical protein
MPMQATSAPCRPPPGGFAPRRIRGALAFAGLAVVLGLGRGAGGEPPDPPLESRVPIVTLDALPPGVPLGRLDDEARARAEAVLGESLFSHRVTGLRARSREPIFTFLLDHPDFAAAVARALRLGKYRVERRDGGYWGDDMRGARGMARVLYAEPGRRLLHLEGLYESRALPTIRGQMLLLIEFDHQDDPGGGTRVEVSITGHVRLDTPLVGPVAQLATTLARPTVERAVERKIRRFFATVARVSRWAHDQPQEFWAALDGHPEIRPDATLVAFRDILLAGQPPVWAREPYHVLPAAALLLEPAADEPTSP